MATEIRTITDTWCDVHLLGDADASERVVATWSGIVAIDKMRRSLDLCDDHRAQIIGDLPEVLERCGTKLDPATAAKVNDARPKAAEQGMHICPRCNLEIGTRAGLTGHARSVHGKPLSVLEEEMGLPPSSGVRKSPGTIDCPVCNKPMMGQAGLGSHMRTHKNEAPALLKRTG